MKIYNWNKLNAEQQQSILQRPEQGTQQVASKVKAIINKIQQNGDKALLQLTQQYECSEMVNLQVTEKEFTDAKKNIAKAQYQAISVAINRIKNYQQSLLTTDQRFNTQDGVICERVIRPIEAVGLYVPGGSTALVSTLMMLAIPAQIATCKTKVLCTPADSQGNINPILLVCAKLCNIERIYKVGGAQAIAAMALGTTAIPKVMKIFGPGNQYVTEAKRQVTQLPQGPTIDMPAGPSELMVIADNNAGPEVVAADLCSQAEHGADSQVILLAQSEKFCQAIKQCLQTQMATLSRRAIIKESLEYARIIQVESIAQAISISNQYAPEHLSLQLENAENFISSITSAGAVFVGPYTAEALGDYITGSNHVLPTYGYGKQLSGLSVKDFSREMSIQYVSKQGLNKLGSYAMQLAEIEGLDAHKRAVELRLEKCYETN